MELGSIGGKFRCTVACKMFIRFIGIDNFLHFTASSFHKS